MQIGKAGASMLTWPDFGCHKRKIVKKKQISLFLKQFLSLFSVRHWLLVLAKKKMNTIAYYANDRNDF